MSERRHEHGARTGGAAVLAVPALLALVLLAGCVSQQPLPEPLTTAQVIELSRQGKAPEEIIDEIRRSRTVYILHARDVKELLDKGVDERVVDYMLETRVRDLERYYRSTWYPYPYGYPYPYYGPFIYGYYCY